MKVIKFGGSSSATPERIKSIIEIVKPRFQEDIALVFSAFGGVTDQLIYTSQLALAGDLEYKQELALIEKRHLGAVRSLVSVSAQSPILAKVLIQANELENVLHGIYLVRECTARTLDHILSFGERLSAYIISEAFKNEGCNVDYLDAREVIRTDSEFGYAKVDFKKTNKLIQDHFASRSTVQVITGFIAISESGETTTLGRSGSDYTASIFAGALRSSSLEIWTDVDGMMTADPRLVSKAFTIPEMSYEEAMELSHFGAKVIFPATMRPAMAHQIPIWIKNTFSPTTSGTRIGANASKGKLIKGISSINNISLLNVQGSGMMGVVGIAMRLFGTLAREKVNVILISQASSEHSICIGLESFNGLRAKKSLEQEFQNEIRNHQIDEITIDNHLSIVAVVGDKMKEHPGTSGRMFSALGRNGVNVIAIAQGSSERNISVVILQTDVSKALNALHEAFFLSHTKTIHLFLVGSGLIGKTLLSQISNQLKKLYDEHHLEIYLNGITNSRKMIFEDKGIELNDCIEKLNKADKKSNIVEFVQKIQNLNFPNSIFVDCTASEEVAGFYQTLLSSNVSVVTPNKRANSGSILTYRQLKAACKANGAQFLYETNVGAGLPIINTINDLLFSGDKVIRIEALLSGTLNFIFSSFKQDSSFSSIVTEAKVKGYTEPDPRDDLSGMDVARKMLILAREVGLSLELSNVQIQNLIPSDCLEQSTIPDFLTALKSHDGEFERLMVEAARCDKKLRYLATLENDTIQVGLQAVASDHPFYNLSGTDNMILLTTERYRDRPMVIRGPGAGAEVTAAGVFADIIRIANYIRV